MSGMHNLNVGNNSLHNIPEKDARRDLLMEIKPFAMDEHKEWFVVFRIDNGDDLGAYIWVYDDLPVRITDIYGLANYCNQAVSPFYIGEDMPKEEVDSAYQIIAEMDERELAGLIDGFSEKVALIKERECGYKERLEYEKGNVKDLEAQRKKPDKTFWFM